MVSIAPALPTSLDGLAILLDVDGTLLDIAPTPYDVRAPASLRRTLARLAKRTGGAVALVSGRPLGDLDLIFAPLRLPAIGGHGAEFRLSPDGASQTPQPAPLDPDLKRRFAEVASVGSGILFEDKGYSLALHYRLAPDKERAVHEAVAEICPNPALLQILPGKAVVEIKRAGFDKGTALRQLMTFAPYAGRRPLFIGDDTTDEAAFAVLPELNGIGISVGRVLAGVAGHFDAPRDVRRWLEQLSKSNGAVVP